MQRGSSRQSMGLRIAHFVQRYPPALGGSEAYFARLSRYLADQGEHVTVFTTSAIDLEGFWKRWARCLPADTSIEDGVEIQRHAPLRWPGRRYVLKALSFLPNRSWQALTMPCNPICPTMWRAAGQCEPRFDLVHATAFPYAWPIACGLRLARRQGIPFLVTPFLHLGDPEDPQDRTRKAYLSPALLRFLRAADVVFVQTEVERSALLEVGLPEEKLILLGMGVDPAECTGGNRQATRSKWNAPNDEVLIGHLANNSEEKGTVDLLRAAEMAWQSGAKFRVILAGPEMPNFLRYWSKFPAKDRVVRLGVLTEAEKRDFFAAIDLFALPSRSDSFGIVLLEAWANGKPNIGYRAGGIAGVIRNETDGLLVRCGDIRLLGEAMQQLVERPQLLKQLGEAGQARLALDYSWHDKLNLVHEQYQRLARLTKPGTAQTQQGPQAVPAGLV